MKTNIFLDSQLFWACWRLSLVLAALCWCAGRQYRLRPVAEVRIRFRLVFQAAGPTAASIQSSVDQYRATVGAPNNGNGPLRVTGRREINWDGGSTINETTAVAGNPFSGFLITRGALFTTPDGTGFVQAPAGTDVSPGGLAGLFGNPTYKTSFRAFSASRLFSAIGGKVTEVNFFVPGGGNVPATVTDSAQSSQMWTNQTEAVRRKNEVTETQAH
jgi:hypothetical protein